MDSRCLRLWTVVFPSTDGLDDDCSQTWSQRPPSSRWTTSVLRLAQQLPVAADGHGGRRGACPAALESYLERFYRNAAAPRSGRRQRFPASRIFTPKRCAIQLRLSRSARRRHLRYTLSTARAIPPHCAADDLERLRRRHDHRANRGVWLPVPGDGPGGAARDGQPLCASADDLRLPLRLFQLRRATQGTPR